MTEPENIDNTPPLDDAKTDAQPSDAVPIDDAAAKPNSETAKSSNLYAIVVSIVLLLIAGGIGTLFFLKKKAETTPESAVAIGPQLEQKGPLATFAKGELAQLQTFEKPQKAAELAFKKDANAPATLADFKGQVVVLNVWATWCAPCRHEMPTLVALQKHYADRGLKVVALSVDIEADLPKVQNFMGVMQPLDIYTDTVFAAPKAFGIQGMPVTLILNKKGEVVARLDGVAEWDSTESYALMDKLLSE